MGERQYAVWGHNLASCELTEVVANIDPKTIDSRRSSISDAHGKPAKSWFVIPAHFAYDSGPRGLLLRRGADRDRDRCSTFLVRIRTGRRRQIRAHMLHAGHPTVTDGKYAAARVAMYRCCSL